MSSGAVQRSAGATNKRVSLVNNMASSWLETLSAAKKTCIVQDGKRKVHFAFADGNEMVEEYDVRTDVLVVRKWRRKNKLGGRDQWEFEIGEEFVSRNLDAEGLVVSSCNPIFTRKDSKCAFEWRIRNLPYPIGVYGVTVDSQARVVIIKTSNKKYYKKFNIVDLDRFELPLEKNRVTIAHANNTLIVKYEKPPPILQIETQLKEELKSLKPMKEGENECNPS